MEKKKIKEIVKNDSVYAKVGEFNVTGIKEVLKDLEFSVEARGRSKSISVFEIYKNNVLWKECPRTSEFIVEYELTEQGKA